jgi:tRNA(adenine34) deaminase
MAGSAAATPVNAASINREASMTVKKKAVPPRKWSAKVHTESTYPPEGLFTKSAAVIARTLASPEVSPKGPGSGMHMLSFYINRAGRNLDAKRLAELQKAKELLHKRIERERNSEKRPVRTRKAA